MRRGARTRWMTAIWNAAVVTFLIVLFAGFSPDRSNGRTLFFILYAIACYSAVTQGIRLTADLFAEERRQGTLGLLVLTGLHPLEIFSSKLAGVVMVAGYGLLGGLPFMAIAFLLGGIPFMQFAGAVAVVLSLLLFCVAIGVLASVLHRDGGQAQVTAAAIALLVTAAPFLILWVTAGSAGGTGSEWLALSPGFGAYAAWNDFASGGVTLFWTHVAVMAGYASLALLCGAAVLKRTWRETSELPGATGWRNWLPSWKSRREKWSRKIRRELTAGDPFCWLAARSNGPAVAAELFVLGVVLLWLAGWFVWGADWPTTGSLMTTSLVVHLGLNCAIAYAAARRFGEERHGGGFEILLSTPLTEANLVRAQRRALLLQFRSVVALILCLDFALCLGGLLVRRWNLESMLSYFLTWALLLLFYFALHVRSAMRAMWIGAWTGRTAYAAIQSAVPVSWPVLILLLPLWSALLRHLPFDNATGVVVTGIVLFLGTLGCFNMAGKVREKLEHELHAIACAPIPAADDARFKGWDPDKIVPPGRWGEFVLVPAGPRDRTKHLLGP